MKRTISTVTLLLAASVTCFAVLFSNFRSWDDLLQTSPDIIIAKCTSSFGAKPSDKRILITDGVIPSDIEVLSVLKGNGKPGPAQLGSWYWPYQGQQFAVFGRYSGEQYSAVEGYRIVPLSRDFPLASLNGKTFDEQMQIILSNRLSNLNEEINRDTQDAASIKQYLKGR